jgi:hypothetical protein
VPAAHCVQLVAPTPVERLPAAQSWQVVWLVVDEK